MIFPNKLDRLHLLEGRGEIDQALGRRDGGTLQTRATFADRTMKQSTGTRDEMRSIANQAPQLGAAEPTTSTPFSLAPIIVDETNHFHTMTLLNRLCRKRSLPGRLSLIDSQVKFRKKTFATLSYSWASLPSLEYETKSVLRWNRFEQIWSAHAMFETLAIFA